MKLLKHYLLLAAVFLLPMLPLFFTADVVHTHDVPVHLARMAAYYKALLDGQFPPRWAGELNYGYGTPVFIFMYPFPYLLGALYLALGASLTLAYKLLLTTSFVLSGIFFYGWITKMTKNKSIALLATMVYQFAPYRLVELTVRGSMAEAFAFTFTPLTLWMLTLFMEKPTIHNGTWVAVATALLVLSHNSISLVFFGIICLYLLFIQIKPRLRLLSFGPLLLGVALAAFYWLPALLEHKYTYGDLFMKDMFLSHFAPVSHFFIPNFTNVLSLQTGGVATWLGLTQTIAIGVALWALITKKLRGGTEKILVLFGFVVLLISFFFMTPVSQFLWERISFLRQFQFPWRFLAAGGLATSLLSVSYLVIKNQKVITLLILITVLSTLYYWKPPLGFDHIDEGYYWNYPLNTTFFGETDVIWSAGPASGFPESRVQIVEGKGTIRDFVRHTDWHAFTIDAQTNVTVVSNTQYFPGWRALVDGVKTPIQFQDQNWRGLLLFTVPTGTHQVEIKFARSKPRLAGEVVSVATLLFLGAANVIWKKKKFSQ